MNKTPLDSLFREVKNKKIRDMLIKRVSLLEQSLKSLSEHINTRELEFSKSLDSANVGHKNRADSIELAIRKIFEELREQSNSKHTSLKGELEAIKNEREHSDKGLFDQVAKLEKELEEWSKETYEYGSQMQILVNSALAGQSSIINFKNGTGTTVVSSVNPQGVVTIQINTSGGGTTINEESVTFSGVTGTLAHTPLTGTLKLYRGGARQQRGVDYTLSGATITLSIASVSGETFLADYQY